jgi:hypothetical protein
LTVAKRIVEAHGGTIRYIEEGPTCFEVVLPTAVPIDQALPMATGLEADACHDRCGI